MAASAKSTAIELPPLALETISIPIIGTSPLICHAWDEKVRKQMLAKHMKKAVGARDAKDPWADFCATLYWLDEKPEKPTEKDVEAGRFGFPVIAFKSAAVEACTSSGAITKIAARQAFHLIGEFVELVGPPPAMREDVTRLNGTKPDIRFRGEFNPWGARLQVQINAGVISAEQTVNLFNLAGFAVGVGEWRPGRNGIYGRFRVAAAGELEGLRP